MKKLIFGMAALAAAMCFGATTEDGVTKERRGSLGPNDMVVTDVDATGIVAARTYTKAEVDRRIETNAPVRSVNGKTGRVELGAGDVGALPNNRTALQGNANFVNAVKNVQVVPTVRKVYTNGMEAVATPDGRINLALPVAPSSKADRYDPNTEPSHSPFLFPSYYAMWLSFKDVYSWSRDHHRVINDRITMGDSETLAAAKRYTDQHSGGGGGGGGVESNEVVEIIHATVDGAARQLPKYLHLYNADSSYPDEAQEYYRSRGDGKVSGGCSAVRDGGFLYRNFDYPFDERAEFVVKMSAGPGRFASVGVAQVGTNLTEQMVTSGKPEYSARYKWLPGATVDGINEHGVVAEINVVDGDPQTSGWRTNATDKAIHPLAAIRWVLDNATNALRAAIYIRDNIRFPAGWTQNFHYMIADESSTHFVEDGHVIGSDELFLFERARMTNFRIRHFPWEGAGMERFNIINDANITNAWYTRAYRRETNPPWVSDLAEVLAYTNEIFDAWDTHPKEHFRDQLNGGDPWWQSVHTSIYDITNRTLRVAVQETDDWYTFAVPVTAPQIDAYTKAETDAKLAEKVGGGDVPSFEQDPNVPAWAKQANPPEGMPTTGLVWSASAGKVKTADGERTIGAADVGAWGNVTDGDFKRILLSDYSDQFYFPDSDNPMVSAYGPNTFVDVKQYSSDSATIIVYTDGTIKYSYLYREGGQWKIQQEFTMIVGGVALGFGIIGTDYEGNAYNVSLPPGGAQGTFAIRDWSSLSAMLDDAASTASRSTVGTKVMTLIDQPVSQKISNAVSSALNTYIDGETGVEYVGKFYGGSLYYVPTGNVYPPND